MKGVKPPMNADKRRWNQDSYPRSSAFTGCPTSRPCAGFYVAGPSQSGYAQGMSKALAFLLLVLPLSAADPVQQMTARLSEEADAFRRIAPSLLAQETLEQKAHKAAPRFRPRVGKDALVPPPTVWQDRQIVSEYGFAAFGGETETLHELRRVVSVDGH